MYAFLPSHSNILATHSVSKWLWFLPLSFSTFIYKCCYTLAHYPPSTLEEEVLKKYVYFKVSDMYYAIPFQVTSVRLWLFIVIFEDWYAITFLRYPLSHLQKHKLYRFCCDPTFLGHFLNSQIETSVYKIWDKMGGGCTMPITLICWIFSRLFFFFFWSWTQDLAFARQAVVLLSYILGLFLGFLSLYSF